MTLIAIPKNSDVEFYEVKRATGKPSKLQEYRIKELQKHGIKAELFYGGSEKD